jgi:hypothetical protein
MDMKTLLFGLILVWAAIHLLHYLLCLLPPRYLLPTVSLRTDSRYLSIVRPSLPIKVVLKSIHLRVETTGFNNRHDDLSIFLARRQNPTRQKLIHLYNSGSVLCLLGMLGSMAMLIWTFWQLSASLWRLSSRNVAVEHSNGPMKRSLILPSALASTGGAAELDEPFLKPIVRVKGASIGHLHPHSLLDSRGHRSPKSPSVGFDGCVHCSNYP